MKQRVITALLILAVMVPHLLMGGLPLRILVFGLAPLVAYEIVSLREGPTDWLMIAVLCGSILYMYMMPEKLYSIGITGLLMFLFCFVICDERFELKDACFIFVITIICTLAIKGIIRIYDTNKLYMIYVGIACYLCDTGAFFFGTFFGKHKLIPRISPKKTWEGAIGGYFCGLVSSLLFALFFLPEAPLDMIIFSSLTLPLVAMVGDLSFSAIKRHYGVKDFGSIFPGHGGVLDRIDSLLFCLMFFNAVMLVWGL